MGDNPNVRAFAECPNCGGFFDPWKEHKAQTAPITLVCPGCKTLFGWDPTTADPDATGSLEHLAPNPPTEPSEN